MAKPKYDPSVTAAKQIKAGKTNDVKAPISGKAQTGDPKKSTGK